MLNIERVRNVPWHQNINKKIGLCLFVYLPFFLSFFFLDIFSFVFSLFSFLSWLLKINCRYIAARSAKKEDYKKQMPEYISTFIFH